MRAKVLSSVLLIGAFVGLLAGVTWLIHLRFESGQAYPEASSLRADPVGAKALFDSYDAVSGLNVQRNFTPFEELDELPEDAVVLLLNVQGWSMYQLAQHESLKKFVADGGRLIVALNPGRVAYKYVDGDEDEVTDEDEVEDVEAVFERRARGNLKDFWGEVTLVRGEHTGGDAECVAVDAVGDLPLSLPWREGGVITDLGDEWEAIYQIEDEVVVAERRQGRGSIVLLTDDYLFSNEALLKHRYTELLTWILGEQRTVIFDETHLGVSEKTGVAKLMRRYRLGGFMAGFAVLMMLVVWRGMSPLLPAHAGRTKGNLILAEHSTEAGLSDLVRRSVASVDLPREAFAQWKQSFIRSAADEAHYAAELKEVHALLADYADSPKRKRKPRELHLKIQTIMNRKKRRRL